MRLNRLVAWRIKELKLGKVTQYDLTYHCSVLARIGRFQEELDILAEEDWMGWRCSSVVTSWAGPPDMPGLNNIVEGAVQAVRMSSGVEERMMRLS